MFGFSIAAPAALPEIDFADRYSLAKALHDGKNIADMEKHIFACYIEEVHDIELIIYSHGYNYCEIMEFAYQETSKNKGENDAVLFIVTPFDEV